MAAEYTPRKEEGKNKVFREVQLGLCRDALPGAEGSSAPEAALRVRSSAVALGSGSNMGIWDKAVGLYLTYSLEKQM